jgi:hypothetical protein
MHITHYTVAPRNPSVRWVPLHREMKENGEPSWLHQRSHLATLRPVRAINWPQSFALKGLCAEDYCLDQEVADTFYFFRREDCDRATASTVSFQFLQDGNAALQGDVLTYQQDELQLGLVELGYLEGFICGPNTSHILRRVFEDDHWGTETEQLQLLRHALLPGLADTFHGQFTKKWNPGRSVLHWKL